MSESMSRVSCLPCWCLKYQCFLSLGNIQSLFFLSAVLMRSTRAEGPNVEFLVCPGLLYCRKHVGGLHNIVKINLEHRRRYPRGRHFRCIAGDQNKSFTFILAVDIQYGSSQINQRIASARHVISCNDMSRTSCRSIAQVKEHSGWQANPNYKDLGFGWDDRTTLSSKFLVFNWICIPSTMNNYYYTRSKKIRGICGMGYM